MTADDDRGIRLDAAAKAAYPELWPDNWKDLPGQNKASLAFHRQAALDRVTAALEAYQGTEGEKAALEGDRPHAITLAVPSDAAMVQQVLGIIAYLTEDGQTAYAVLSSGDGLRASWVGMCAIAQDYLLKLPWAGRSDA
jgi:hypothetical protein